MSTFPFHMAMAALAGASVAAFSSYYFHRRALAQLLEYALAVERRRVGGDANSSSRGGSPNTRKGKQRRGKWKVSRKGISMPEGVYQMIDEKGGAVVVRKERGLSLIESLPENSYESAHVLSDFAPD